MDEPRRTVNVHEAKTHFSRLIDAAHRGATGAAAGRQTRLPRATVAIAAQAMDSLLLDTHALLWWLAEPERLSPFASVRFKLWQAYLKLVKRAHHAITF